MREEMACFERIFSQDRFLFLKSYVLSKFLYVGEVFGDVINENPINGGSGYAVTNSIFDGKRYVRGVSDVMKCQVKRYLSQNVTNTRYN